MRIEKKLWGFTERGEVHLYSLRNGVMDVSLTNLGCTVTDIVINEKNIILGYTNFNDLLTDKYYMGSIVGRYAGRISNASFDIDGVNYTLAANDGSTGNHLHGGHQGFNTILFREVSTHSAERYAALTLRGISQHMDEGYPGTVDLTFTITLNIDNEIIFSYYARTDQSTHINLTHHLYYNLNGRSQVNDQHLFIVSQQIVQTSDLYVPTGRIVEAPEKLDFTSARPIPSDKDFNDCYVVNDTNKLALVAELTDKDSTLKMQVASTCPGLIFYSGQFLNSPFLPRQGVCLETQYFPDSPNQPAFPSTLYNNNKSFKEYTKLSFQKAI